MSDELLVLNKVNQLSKIIKDIRSVTGKIEKWNDDSGTVKSYTSYDTTNKWYSLIARNDGTTVPLGVTTYTTTSCYDVYQVGQTFVGNGKNIVGISVRLYASQQPTGDVICEIRSGGLTGPVIATSILPSTAISGSSGATTTIYFQQTPVLTSGQTYAVVFRSPTTRYTGNGGGYYNIWVSSSSVNEYSSGAMYTSSNGTSWTMYYSNGADMIATLLYGVDDQLSGTVSKTFYLGSAINALSKFNFAYTATSSQTVIVDILDQNNNIIMADVKSGVDLSSLTQDAYSAITVRFTLSRGAVSNGTPKVTSWEMQYLTSASMGVASMKPNFYNHYSVIGLWSQNQTYLDLFTINGSGILLDFKAVSTLSSAFEFALVIDGVEYPLGTDGNGAWSTFDRVKESMYYDVLMGTNDQFIGTSFNGMVPFNSSLTVRIKRAGASTTYWTSTTNYYQSVNLVYNT